MVHGPWNAHVVAELVHVEPTPLALPTFPESVGSYHQQDRYQTGPESFQAVRGEQMQQQLQARGKQLYDALDEVQKLQSALSSVRGELESERQISNQRVPQDERVAPLPGLRSDVRPRPIRSIDSPRRSPMHLHSAPERAEHGPLGAHEISGPVRVEQTSPERLATYPIAAAEAGPEVQVPQIIEGAMVKSELRPQAHAINTQLHTQAPPEEKSYNPNYGRPVPPAVRWQPETSVGLVFNMMSNRLESLHLSLCPAGTSRRSCRPRCDSARD